MIDKQKGLILAVQQIFPDPEHRFCVRHLYSNFQVHFKGENLKNQLRACARSSSVIEWMANMEEMAALNQDAHDWLKKMQPSTWVGAYFNKQIEVAEQWTGPICPKIRKKILKNADMANTCYSLLAGKGIFEVQDKNFKFIVDINAKNCDCRRWDLIGIPCSHAISSLRYRRINA